MKKIVIGIVTVIILVFVLVAASSKEQETPTSNSTSDITLQDAHGLAVDRKDSTKVYIATHTGLLAMSNDADLQRVSEAQDDYMGFSAHPTDATTFYSSGHPSGGGNIGFQKSTDGGKTWQKVSNGAGGPVDFHTMTVSQADPNMIYGVYRGQLQRSSDEGKNWELVSAANIGNIITLATDAASKDTLYAGTTNGLYVSQDKGSNWSKAGGLDGAVTAVSVSTTDSKTIVAYADGRGLMKSSDGGTSWTNLKGYTGNMVMQLAADNQNPSTLYLINQSLEIHKTTDSGETWTKVR